jgi:hypothetical protein
MGLSVGEERINVAKTIEEMDLELSECKEA